MKYETINNTQIPKIGFGSARLGGRFVGAFWLIATTMSFFFPPCARPSTLFLSIRLSFVTKQDSLAPN
jgi:hypothetical protein